LNESYQAFAERLQGTGLVTDPWVEGAPRFRAQTWSITSAEHAALTGAAEAVAAAHHELVVLVAQEPALLDDFFALTPVQKLLFGSSAPLWHALARADVFLLGDPASAARPPAVCELNCDTPSGLAEAMVLGALAALPPAHDPNLLLERRFARLLATFLAAVDRTGGDGPATVGIIYPTEIAGDFGLIRLYQDWCQRAGYQVVLGSPFNLTTTSDGGLALFGQPCQLLLRHYKTDWWGERLPIWDDEDPYPDPAPLGGPLAVVLRALATRRCAMVNPFAAVLPQNKRAMAFMWERQARFSPEGQAAIRAHVPQTLRLETADRRQLMAEQEAWVLKSDYGCEGEEVIIGADTSAGDWRASLEHALPERWVVQRRFQARRQPADPGGDALTANHGVFLIGGRAAGLYTRLSAGATDAGALSVATEIRP
jgi:glutathionylspermidine synthase